MMVLSCLFILIAGCTTGDSRRGSPETVDLDSISTNDTEEAKSIMYGPQPGESSNTQKIEQNVKKQDLLLLKKEMPKIALVLGPGGSRGFAHLGVIKALESNGIKISFVSGAGVGALVGGLYAMDGNSNQLEWQLYKLREETYFDRPMLSLSKGAAEGKKVFDFLNEVFKNKNIRDFKFGFSLNAVSKNSRKLQSFRNGHAATLIRASLGIPGFMKPVKFGNDSWTSGATLDPLPVDVIRRTGAEFVIAVNLLSEMGSTGISGRENSAELNGLLSAMSALSHKAELDSDFVIRPDLDGFDMFSFARRADTVFRGKKTTISSIHALKKRILDFIKAKAQKELELKNSEKTEDTEEKIEKE